MGTNYYLHRKVCEWCGRGDEPLHIGKSSAGWCFALHVIPDLGITDLNKWEPLFAEEGAVIKNEYDEILPADEMLNIITNRFWRKRQDSEQWYKDNDAMPGPNGLARHTIFRNCVMHGEGTWDCIVGEFS